MIFLYEELLHPCKRHHCANYKDYHFLSFQISKLKGVSDPQPLLVLIRQFQRNAVYEITI